MTKTLLASVADIIKGPRVQINLPLFTLGAVLFPGGKASLRVFEQRYMDMVKSAMKSQTPFGMVLIREGKEVGAAAIPEEIGTLARITDWDMAQLGVLQISVEGGQRFRVLTHQPDASGLVLAQVEYLADDLPSEGSKQLACANFLRNVLAQLPEPVPEDARFSDASWVSFRLSELLPFSNSIKQKMLALTDSGMRVEILYQFLLDRQLIER